MFNQPHVSARLVAASWKLRIDDEVNAVDPPRSRYRLA
jgi:hypothetical protein